MESTFRLQLSRLPFMAALMIAVAGMPLDIYAYNQQQIGHAHAAPWLRKAATAICDTAKGIFDTACAALKSPQFWRVAVPTAALVLMATGYLDTSGSVGLMAGTTIQDLLDKKKGLVTSATEIRDRVYAEQAGEWRGDDTKKFDDLMTQADSVTTEIERAAKLDAAARSIEEAGEPQKRKAAVVPPNSRDSRVTQPATEDRALALHGWLASGSDDTEHLVTERHKVAAQRCGINFDRKRLRMRLPQVALRSTRPEDVREWEQRLTQVGIVSPDLGGHYTVPDEMMRPLEVAMLMFGGMRQVATVIRTQTGAELPNPTLNDTSNEGIELGEGAEHTELDTEFNQLLLHSFKYSSRQVPVSVEYLQDNAVNFVGRIGAILGERIGRITNRRFTTGSGSSQPNGIVTAATSSGITTASPTAITYDEIVDLKHSVDPAYRAQGARFMFNDNVLKLLKKIKVAQYSGDTGGFPLWRAGLAAGEPDTIDGDPYTINQHMANPTASQKSMLYGLLSKYLIRDVRDVTLVRLDERYAELGVVAFLAFSRHDGDLLDAGTHPVKYLTMHS